MTRRNLFTYLGGAFASFFGIKPTVPSTDNVRIYRQGSIQDVSLVPGTWYWISTVHDAGRGGSTMEVQSFVDITHL